MIERFVEQSNLIEGITRPPTVAEVDAHEYFLGLPQITIWDLENFVSVVAPGKALRRRPGMDVRVGGHLPPRGGPEIVSRLQAILDEANDPSSDAHAVHCAYESLHPFMDGNGRSGRVLWLWQYRNRALPPLLFLHRFYYDALGALSERSKPATIPVPADVELLAALENIAGGKNIPGVTSDAVIAGKWQDICARMQDYARATVALAAARNLETGGA